MIYAPVDWIVRALMLSPETVKHLVDNEDMINPEHVFKLHSVAKSHTRRSERQGSSYVVVSDDLKWNIVKTVLSSHNYVPPINMKAAENGEYLGQSSGATRAHSGNNYAELAGNGPPAPWYNRAGVSIRANIARLLRLR